MGTQKDEQIIASQRLITQGDLYSHTGQRIVRAEDNVPIGRPAHHPGDGNNYTTDGEVFIGADTSSSAATITISDADANSTGFWVLIQDIGGNAGTNSITVTAETDGSHNVDGSDQDLTISTNNGNLLIFADDSGDLWSK